MRTGGPVRRILGGRRRPWIVLAWGTRPARQAPWPRSGGAAGGQVAVGALALALAGLAAKACSAVYRVLLARWLGAETIGLYEMAAPVLGLGISVCGLGLPVAASARVAAAMGRGDGASARRLARISRLLLFVSGSLGTVAVLALARPLARLLGNSQAAGPLAAIAPAILLACLLAGEKAWLQGSGRVAASAASVAVEQAARVAAALGAAAAFIGLTRGQAPAAAAAVAWSPAAGAAAGLAATALTDRLVPAALGEGQSQSPETAGAPARELLRGGWPNWGAAVTASLTTAVDAALVAWRLRAAGYTAYGATARLGALSGMAMPLAAGPAVLFSALASALVPSVARDWARGDVARARDRAAAAYFWSLAVAVPAAVTLAQFAGPLCGILYHNAVAAQALSVLAWTGLPLAVGYVASALANAVGEPALLLPGVFAGAALRGLGVYALTGRFGLDIRGAALGIVLGQAVGALWNAASVSRRTGCRPPWAGAALCCLPAVAVQLVAGHLAPGLGGSGVLRVGTAGACGLLGYGLAFLAAWRLLRGRLGLPQRLPLG